MNFSMQNESCRNISDLVDRTIIKDNPWIFGYLSPTLEALIITTNLLVVISSGVIWKKGHQPRSTYLFLGNVAMADLIMGFSWVLIQTVPKKYKDHNICALELGLTYSSAIASVYSIGLIGIDRFLYITHGMQYQKWVYPGRAILSICIAWLIGLIVGFLPLMGWYGDTGNGKFCWYTLLAPPELVFLASVIVFIPLILVLFLYVVILYQAVKTINQLQRAGKSNKGILIGENGPAGNIRMFRGGTSKSDLQIGEQQQKQQEGKDINKKENTRQKVSASVNSPKKWKAIKVVLFTTGGFLITWFPYMAVCLIYVYNCDAKNCSTKCKHIRYLLAVPFAFLRTLNCLLNPIIYAWWHRGFRSFVKKTATSVLKNANERIGSISSSRTISSTNASVANGQYNEAFVSDINLSTKL